MTASYSQPVAIRRSSFIAPREADAQAYERRVNGRRRQRVTLRRVGMVVAVLVAIEVVWGLGSLVAWMVAR